MSHREYRIVVVGHGGVGKSALTVMFLQGTFLSRYDPTIEDNYRTFIDVDGISCTMDIMDTAGQEEFAALKDMYMKTGDGFVIVYSIASRLSFDAATKFRNDICRVQDDKQEIPILLVGNKLDIENEREVWFDEAVELAKRFGIEKVMEVSAKANKGVAEMFFDCVRAINNWRDKYEPAKKKRKVMRRRK